MKKILLFLVISIGLVSVYFSYELADEKAAASASAEQSELLDAELAAFEAELIAKLTLKEKETKIERQAALDAFQAKLAADKAAAAASTAAYQDSLLEEELAAFEAQLEAELAAQEMMAEIQAEMERQAALDAFQAKLAADKAAAAASTAAYQDSLLEEELAAFEAQLEAELAAQEMMAEIQAEMARKAALDAFQAKLAADKAAAAASTAAYQAKLASEAIEKELDEFEAQLMEELLEESTGVEIIITGETHNLCKTTLGLSETNIQLFKKALSGEYLFSTGPQGENGTEFSSTRWDNYISCISSLNNEL
jgi:colicin import membrane protein